MKLLVAIGVIASVGWWFWGRTLEPARVVHAQLEAIGKHDYQAAYDLLSDNAKQRLTPEQFVELIQRNKIVENNYTSEFLDRRMEKDVATFSGTVRALGREKTPATFTVVKQADRWVIDQFHF
jgi:hypothetical protein